MLHSKQLKWAVGILGAAATGTICTVALATPSAGVTPETLVTASFLEEALLNHDRVKFQTKGESTVRMQKLTFAPGATTGWHHHPGIVIAAVASGSITLRKANCGVSSTYGPGSPAGSVFAEGHNESHMATSAGGAVVYVTYVDPSATFRVDDPSPCP